MRMSLPVVKNLNEATFECIYGRGCDGICCQNGRPPVYPQEAKVIRKNLKKFLPELRPEARALIAKEGFLSGRLKDGQPMLRVVGGWCVFFNQGCVLHKVGATEGDRYRYKPFMCSVFPLTKNEKDEWIVRQAGYENEAWDLFCLKPDATDLRAKKSLQTELQLVQQSGSMLNGHSNRKPRKRPSPAKRR
jgi:hypothetical protein